MSTDMQQDADRITTPVPVTVKNWPDPPAKKPEVKNTILRTVLLSATGDGTSIPIADYEPKRIRLVLIVHDSACTINDTLPSVSPDTSAAGTKPNSGAVLPNGTIPYEFYGPDALWLNRLGTDTRVSIIKEYCQ